MIAAALGISLAYCMLSIAYGVLRIFAVVLAYRDRQALRNWHEQVAMAKACEDVRR